MKPQQKQKLELTWIGKGEEPKLEPRILIEQPELSYGDPTTGNMLIQGDNLLALKALEQDFAGKVKCIFIDPPYNTGSAFEHYDDGLEHSQWLNLMVPRLRILRELLSEDGSIWVTIDDNEAHYLKVVMDEIFGRRNFVANVIWQKRTSPDARLYIGDAHDHVLLYSKSSPKFALNRVPLNASQSAQFKNPDNDPRGPWTSTDFTAQGWRPNQMYKLTTSAGVEYEPPPGRCWANIESEFLRLVGDNRVWFGKDGKSRPRTKNFLSEHEGVRAWSWWSNAEVGHNQEAKKEINDLFGADTAFATPKPERLLHRIITLSTNQNDLVLDSFLGSGTTAAVAQKMGRRYIGIELGDHARTHCQPRLKKVVDGSDQGGISKAVGWQGGGGFRYFTLAPSLLNRDKYGNWIISKEYNPDMLAAAMAKQEGFRYQPDELVYWKQARSSEKDFLFTTTAFLTAEMLDGIHDEMQPEESLLIACKAFQRECRNRHANISIKKIPHMLLGRCEFGREDYSLNIVQVPVEESPDELADEPDELPENDAPARSVQTNLFD
ncbi:DNA methylase N-4 [Chlorobaculum limnaeum]|uniref:site-specific DNA-methyltransferase (adenine-specific) n=1 Tax=Chlorobaculum limnaeum TaxID=274537 RepID=A0A1D8D887_CHLLM|nr:DNA methylase N-4 [Chlorobaculum limnaeum]